DHASFGGAGGARGEDQTGQIGRRWLHFKRRRILTSMFIKRGNRYCTVASCLKSVAMKYELEGIKLAGDGGYAFQVRRFANQQLGVGIGYLVAQELPAQGGIDGHTDSAELVNCQPADNSVNIVVQHGDDRVASLNTQFRQGVGKLGRN